MKTTQYNSFESFIEQNSNRIFRYWIYRRIYTPFENDKKYSDESFYEDTVCTCAYIRECIALPNGDYLLGFEDAEMVNLQEEGIKQHLEYCKLSEIRLAYYEGDVDEFPY